ncbi:MAG: LPXTG cell wall anchor domain-containing protein, partial [Acidimicrobiales bacterium]|nr:LPXTG cell wall anchor domain-containing protein [Acidimicrobiales bacterium]
VCTYENKGAHAGSTEGLYVPGGEKHTYLVSESGLPDGWTAVEGIGEFSARERCPRGDDDDHTEHVASGEGGGTVCPHLVVNRQAPSPPTTTTTTALPGGTTAPVAVAPAGTDRPLGGSSTPTGTLARTGDDSTGPALVGLALIAVGTAVLALRRRAGRGATMAR